ncbi:MAG TPA: HAD-IA family hydrolase [Thermoanaerobaculia bacterium]|nr:HAD-IA family hydrolase [Thermoanaerobaculia bacterium]
MCALDARPLPSRPELDAYRLLVFDWDGTLMDSVATIVECARAAFRDLGIGELTEATVRGTVGLGLRETVETLCPGCDQELFLRVAECYRRLWFATYRELPLLFPGVAEMLDELAGQGYLLAVATGKSRRGLDHDLASTGLAARFHSTRTADEARSKPHPQMLLDILDDLAVAAAAAVMIGDTTYDLEMARSAGTDAVAVLSGTQTRRQLEPLAPRAFLREIVELPAWLAAAERPAAAPAASAGRI